MNYLNRNLITKINELKMVCNGLGLTVAQTNSRYCGRYLNAVRVYQNACDKGHKTRAIFTARNLSDIESYITSNMQERP